MEKTALNPVFIMLMSAIFLLRPSPRGLADISNRITPEFMWFFIPAITGQLIFYSFRIVRMAVGPETWKKMEEHGIERKVTVVCLGLEMLVIHKMLVLYFKDGPVWARFIAGWTTIWAIAFLCLHHALLLCQRVIGGPGY